LSGQLNLEFAISCLLSHQGTNIAVASFLNQENTTSVFNKYKASITCHHNDCVALNILLVQSA
jgi:hypothetical protein